MYDGCLRPGQHEAHMFEPILYWLSATDRGLSPATSLGVLVVVLLTLTLATALFVFAGN